MPTITLAHPCNLEYELERQLRRARVADLVERIEAAGRLTRWAMSTETASAAPMDRLGSRTFSIFAIRTRI